MRILLVHNYYRRWGGADATVRFDAGLLRSAGHEVVEYSRHSSEMAGRGATALSAFHSTRTVQDIHRLCRDRFDVAHVHNVMPLISPSVYGAIARHGIPIVQTVNDYRMMCVNGVFFTQGAVCTRCRDGNFLHALPRTCHPEGKAATWLYAAVLGLARMTRTFMRHVTLFMAVSDFVRRQLRQTGIPEARIMVKGNIPTLEVSPSYAAGRYGLYMGRLSAEKGVWTLLRALEGRRDFPFKIAGTGPEEASMRKHVAERGMGHVEFLGFVEGTARFDLLRGAAFLACPSECHETFGISPLEALSVGTPVVAARSGGLPELVVPGVTGALFDPQDAVGLTAAMGEARGWDAEIRRSARRFFDERLTSRAALDGLERAYSRALGR